MSSNGGLLIKITKSLFACLMGAKLDIFPGMTKKNMFYNMFLR